MAKKKYIVRIETQDKDYYLGKVDGVLSVVDGRHKTFYTTYEDALMAVAEWGCGADEEPTIIEQVIGGWQKYGKVEG